MLWSESSTWRTAPSFTLRAWSQVWGVVTICLFQVDDLNTDKEVPSAQVTGEYAKEALGTIDDLGLGFLESLRGSFSHEGEQ